MSVQTVKWSATKVEACATNPDLALRWFDLTEQEIEKECGRFASGKNKGKLRGWVVYRKAEVGGWSFGAKCVIRPGMIFARFCYTYDAMGECFSMATERFMAVATRVDTQYGYSRQTAAARQTQEDTQRNAIVEAQRAADEKAKANLAAMQRIRDEVMVEMETPEFDGMSFNDRSAHFNRRCLERMQVEVIPNI